MLQDRRVSSHYSQGQPKNQCWTPSPKPFGQRRMMTRNLLPSVAVSMGVRHQLIMAGVNGAVFGSSLEPSTWDCHQAIKSIIFSVRSRDGGSSNGLRRWDGHYSTFDGHFYRWFVKRQWVSTDKKIYNTTTRVNKTRHNDQHNMQRLLAITQ